MWGVSVRVPLVDLLLCGFGAFMAVQVIKIFSLPTILAAQLKMLLALAASYGIATGLFLHHTAELVIYGAAGAGLAIVIHRLARLLSVTGDWIIKEILRKTHRPG
jgi:hypothetical protein